jgi:hypothetical protein
VPFPWFPCCEPICCGGAESQGGQVPDTLTLTITKVSGDGDCCTFVGTYTLTYNSGTNAWLSGLTSVLCGIFQSVQFQLSCTSADGWRSGVSFTSGCSYQPVVPSATLNSCSPFSFTEDFDLTGTCGCTPAVFRFAITE